MISTQTWLAIRASSFVTFSALFILGCASEEQSWKNAKEANSAEEYSAFVDDFPDGRNSGLAHWRLQESIRSLHIEAYQLLEGNDDGYSEPSAIYSRILRIDPDNAHALNNMAFIVLSSEMDYDAPSSEQQGVIKKARKLTERAFDAANRRAISPHRLTIVLDRALFSAFQVPDYNNRSSSLRGEVGGNLEQLNSLLDKPFSFPDFPLKALVVRGKLIDENGEPLANEELWLMPAILHEEDDASSFSFSQSTFFDKAGRSVSPSTITDESGAFLFTIDERTERNLEPYTGKTMGIFSDRIRTGSKNLPSLPVYRFDVPFVFQPDPDAASMQFGELTLRVLRAAKSDPEIPPPDNASDTTSPATTEITEKQRREELLRQARAEADIIQAKIKRAEMDSLVAGTDCSAYANAGELAAKTPEQLFRSILARSQNQCYDEIRPLIVTIPGDERMRDAGYRDSWELAIEMIKTQAYPSNGDFAYSNAGLKVLIEHHLNKFGTMPAEYHNRMRQEEPYASVSDVQEALENDPDGFLVMTHNGVNVVVVRVRGKYRLLFWEHLPKLAGGRRQLE